VPSGDDILVQLEGMSFGDESASKKPKPIEKPKTDKNKKQKKRKKTPTKKKQVTDEIVWKKKSIFFKLLYWKNNLLRHNLDVMHIEKCYGQHSWHLTGHQRKNQGQSRSTQRLERNGFEAYTSSFHTEWENVHSRSLSHDVY
jgi:hypothetical protein